MKKEEFLRELAYRLRDLSPEEREEALAYYRDYLEDAGPEAEAEVLRELGSPAQVAAAIRAGLRGEEQGEFSEHGYGDPRFRGPAYPPGRPGGRGSDAYGAGRGPGGRGPDAYGTGGEYRESHGTERKMSGGMVALLVVLCILAAPMILALGLGVGGGILGLLFGIAGTALGLMLAAGGLTLGLLVGGIACLGGGIFGWAFFPLGGAAACFAGVALLGLGLLALALSIWFYGTAVPAVFRWIRRGFRRLFGRKSRGGEAA